MKDEPRKALFCLCSSFILHPSSFPKRRMKPMNSLMKSNRIVALVACLVLPAAVAYLPAGEPDQPASGKAAVRFPTVPAEHEHARALLENACALFAPDNKMIDPASGYPFEGWNNDPKQGLLLHSFTQLTTVALWMEL